MGNVFDIFTGTEFKDGHEDYATREERCLTKKLNDGLCDCDVCQFKRNLAAELVEFSSKRCVEFMKNKQTALYMIDLLYSIKIAEEYIKTTYGKKNG